MFEKINALLNSKTFSQAVKFSIVGVINTFISFIIIFFLQNVILLYYVIANAAGYSAGIINSFFWNKFWTFKSKESIKKEVLFFIIVTGVSYIVQLLAVILVKEKFGVNVNYAQLIGIIVYIILNFIGNKFLTFNNINNPKAML
jgi:putative flippase GtrA